MHPHTHLCTTCSCAPAAEPDHPFTAEFISENLPMLSAHSDAVLEVAGGTVQVIGEDPKQQWTAVDVSVRYFTSVGEAHGYIWVTPFYRDRDVLGVEVLYPYTEHGDSEYVEYRVTKSGSVEVTDVVVSESTEADVS